MKYAGIYVIPAEHLAATRNMNRTLGAGQRLAAYNMRQAARRNGVTLAGDLDARISRSNFPGDNHLAIRVEQDTAATHAAKIMGRLNVSQP